MKIVENKLGLYLCNCIYSQSNKAKATRLSGLTHRVMVSYSFIPSSYPANRKGYNSYLSALGINPKDQTTVLFAAIPFEKFKSLDRRSIDEKIQEAALECERLHDVYQDAIENCRETDAAFAEAGWNRRSNEFVNLVKSKHND
jgi:hypothetical protein